MFMKNFSRIFLNKARLIVIMRGNTLENKLDGLIPNIQATVSLSHDPHDPYRTSTIYKPRWPELFERYRRAIGSYMPHSYRK